MIHGLGCSHVVECFPNVKGFMAIKMVTHYCLMPEKGELAPNVNDALNLKIKS